jgi:hypothetical protein
VVIFSSFGRAQSISFGVVGGASVTGDFSGSFQPIPGTPLLSGPRSEPERYIIGGMLEFQLPADWSIEVDGLYHPLRYDGATIYPNGTVTLGSPSPVITYEFPILAKYRFRWGAWRPFVEAGPSFRTAGNLNGTNPSHYGVAAGAGAEFRLGKFRIAPEVRYIRWARESAFLYGPPVTRPDQIELVTSFSTGGVTGNVRALRRYISLGVVAGVTVSPDFRGAQGAFEFSNGTQTITQAYSDSSGPPGFLVGPMIEFALAKGFFVEGDAIRRPMASREQISQNGQFISISRTISSWSYPVLGKYKLPVGNWKPFVEAGPSFRLTHELNQDLSLRVSPFGVTAGVGIETHFRHLKIAPVIRYTYWGGSSIDFPAAILPYRNQVEVLGGIFF